MITRWFSKLLFVAAFALVVPSVARPALAASHTVHGRRAHHHRHHAPRHPRHRAHGRTAERPHEL